jgi:hypothetical protein
MMDWGLTMNYTSHGRNFEKFRGMIGRERKPPAVNEREKRKREYERGRIGKREGPQE